MRENIFLNVKCGNKFLLRNGGYSVFWHSFNNKMYFILPNGQYYVTDNNGIAIEVDNGFDIVSRYEISKRELEELAYESCMAIKKNGYIDDDIYVLERGFKAGYKAKE